MRINHTYMKGFFAVTLPGINIWISSAGIVILVNNCFFSLWNCREKFLQLTIEWTSGWQGKDQQRFLSAASIFTESGPVIMKIQHENWGGSGEKSWKTSRECARQRHRVYLSLSLIIDLSGSMMFVRILQFEHFWLGKMKKNLKKNISNQGYSWKNPSWLQTARGGGTRVCF